MTSRLLVGVGQLNSTPDIEQNFVEIERITARAAARGCDLIMFPECAPQMRPDRTRVNAAETLQGAQVRACQALCKKHEMGMLLGSFAQKSDSPERFYNTSVFMDRQGAILAHYQKIHLFEAWAGDKRTHHEAAHVVPGPAKPTVVAFEGWKFGLSVCYDLRFPEMYRLLVDAGAEVLCVPSAFTYETGAAHWETLLRARAIENTVYAIAPAQTQENYSGRRTWGHSMAVSPWGEIIGQMGHETGLFVVELDKARLHDAAQRNPSVANRRFDAIGPVDPT